MSKLEDHESTQKDGTAPTNAFAFRTQRLSNGESYERILNFSMTMQ